jgi:hypothetical protein
LSQIPDDLLGLDGKALVFGVFGHLANNRLAQRPKGVAFLRCRFPSNRAQRFSQVTQHTHFDDVVLIDFGRRHVDMDNGLAAVGVPLLRVVFDHVVADADNHVGLLETEGDPVFGF